MASFSLGAFWCEGETFSHLSAQRPPFSEFLGECGCWEGAGVPHEVVPILRATQPQAAAMLGAAHLIPASVLWLYRQDLNP